MRPDYVEPVLMWGILILTTLSAGLGVAWLVLLGFAAVEKMRARR